MKRSALVALLLGLLAAITLLVTNNFVLIAEALRGAGWGIILVIALHLPQTLFSTLGWRPLIDEAKPPGAALLYRLRWIRESANALLPVAQIGGDFIRARLLAQQGTPLKIAVASTMVDLSIEMAAQVVFTIFGVALLIAGPHMGDVIPLSIGATVMAGVIAVSFMASQRFGLFKLLEPLIARTATGGSWSFLGELSGLNDAVVALYRQPRRVWTSGGHHLISWGLGAVETLVALKILGIDATLRQAIIIEGLGQAVRGLAFFVPAALGVQEGGYLLICAMFGISPQNALALSLIRRIRELALGVPGLVVWHVTEQSRRRRDLATERAAETA